MKISEISKDINKLKRAFEIRENFEYLNLALASFTIVFFGYFGIVKLVTTINTQIKDLKFLESSIEKANIKLADMEIKSESIKDYVFYLDSIEEAIPRNSGAQDYVVSLNNIVRNNGFVQKSLVFNSENPDTISIELTVIGIKDSITKLITGIEEQRRFTIIKDLDFDLREAEARGRLNLIIFRNEGIEQ